LGNSVRIANASGFGGTFPEDDVGSIPVLSVYEQLISEQITFITPLSPGPPSQRITQSYSSSMSAAPRRGCRLDSAPGDDERQYAQ
jgi:hypothetical protein